MSKPSFLELRQELVRLDLIRADLELDPQLEKDYLKLKELLPQFGVVEDDSEVMESPDAFVAKIHYKTSKITLNPHFISQSPYPNLVKEFLVGHELGHIIWRKSPHPTLSEEIYCDSLALFSLLRETRNQSE